MFIETLQAFLFSFLALARERIFIQTLSTENSLVKGPENTLFQGAYVHNYFSPETEFYGMEQRRG